MKNNLLSYVVQFTALELMHPHQYWRIAFDLLVLHDMNAGDIMKEIEFRCISEVRNRTKREITGDRIMYSVISCLNLRTPK